MPKITDDSMQAINTGSNYQFSAVKIDSLGASEYTVASLLVDCSGSLSGQERNLEKMMKEVLNACKKSPRSENLMLRVILFNDNETEVHGFRLLSTIDETEYDNIVQANGMTRLYDSAYHTIESTMSYAKILNDHDFLCNSVLFFLTDGCDNQSTFGPGQIKRLLEDSIKTEIIESVNTILIGMTGDQSVISSLQLFQHDAGITQYIDTGDVTAKKIAKLATFVSQSISSTSQALGTGGISKSLSF